MTAQNRVQRASAVGVLATVAGLAAVVATRGNEAILPPIPAAAVSDAGPPLVPPSTQSPGNESLPAELDRAAGPRAPGRAPYVLGSGRLPPSSAALLNEADSLAAKQQFRAADELYLEAFEASGGDFGRINDFRDRASLLQRWLATARELGDPELKEFILDRLLNAARVDDDALAALGGAERLQELKRERIEVLSALGSWDRISGVSPEGGIISQSLEALVRLQSENFHDALAREAAAHSAQKFGDLGGARDLIVGDGFARGEDPRRAAAYYSAALQQSLSPALQDAARVGLVYSHAKMDPPDVAAATSAILDLYASWSARPRPARAFDRLAKGWSGSVPPDTSVAHALSNPALARSVADRLETVVASRFANAPADDPVAAFYRRALADACRAAGR